MTGASDLRKRDFEQVSADSVRLSSLLATTGEKTYDETYKYRVSEKAGIEQGVARSLAAGIDCGIAVRAMRIQRKTVTCVCLVPANNLSDGQVLNSHKVECDHNG
ncbi:hypothetical protein [Desulfogranum japonicum]|uniref:hypothetical protein n=1 Tax=Desulfogranum japonicum TaxID=231447 RepID=UPI00048FDDB9|nr:hypothetical protein [Desulfogranum japonicum]